MKITYKASTFWECQGCSYHGIPQEDETCSLCEYTGKEIRQWMKEREMVNFLIEEFNQGRLLVKP